MARPHVTLKLATSLDGRIATAAGESRWITGEAARAEVHKMRAGVDAVMIGIGTAIADDPELTARTTPPPARQPLRVIMDHKMRLPLNARLARSAGKTAATLVLSSNGWPPDHLPKPLWEGDVSVDMAKPADGEGEVMAGLRLLKRQYSVSTLLLEGGGVLAAAAIREGVVDRIEWFRAPILLGGEGRPAIAALSLAALADAPRWRRVALRELGPDLWESYERV
jgi:diaminohydroxyphosphoribosylaminopyrimidine deaminase / 5-amino-6-(5-phosphoribosylamino)uracil reductase